MKTGCTYDSCWAVVAVVICPVHGVPEGSVQIDGFHKRPEEPNRKTGRVLTRSWATRFFGEAEGPSFQGLEGPVRGSLDDYR